MEEFEVVNITVSDGTQKEFAIIKTFSVDEADYMAVALVEGDEINEDGIYIYAYENDENGEMDIFPIEDMEEYEKVVAAYESDVEE